MIRGIFALLFISPWCFAESNGGTGWEFESLKSLSTAALDCRFETRDLSGRLRLSAVGEVHLLLKSPKTRARYECTLIAERLTQNTALVVPRTSVHFFVPAQCRPELPADLKKMITPEIEMEISRRNKALWIQDGERAATCDGPRTDRRALIRVVREISRVTGTGARAEENF